MSEMESQDEQQAASLFEDALAFTDDLPASTSESFGGVRYLLRPTLGMLYNVAQRLIDAKGRGGEGNAADEALILLCNRLFNECFTGYVVLTRGLLGPGHHNLRAALELANLAILFIVEPQHAERWLGGREYSPATVRKLLNVSQEARAWYGYLSKLTHANVQASATTVYPIQGGHMLFYGGHKAPRAAALTCLAFVWVALTVLRLFYARNSERLAKLDLLWHPNIAPQAAADDTFTWDQFFTFFTAIVEAVQDDIENLPEDAVRTEEWAQEILESRGQ